MTADKLNANLATNSIIAKLTNHVQRNRLIIPTTDQPQDQPQDDAKPEETHQGATPENRKLSFSFPPISQS